MAVAAEEAGAGAGRRLVEVDSLRGVAALAVVAFHYSTRFVELYGAGGGGPSLKVPWGHYGVNLFFIISGFVIFMTLARTRRPMDFVVSRFSRLYPAYWAAVAMTFAVTSLVGLPGKAVTLTQALVNLTMLHGFVRVPHVDGVYWTLEVELLFYAGMLLVFARGWLGRVHLFLLALLALRLAYHVAALYGHDWSWTLSRLLILPYLPWFALGICVYEATAASASPPLLRRITVLAALACLAIVDGPGLALLALVLATTVWMAAAGHLRWLGHPILAYFGTISYTLYLLHENIGWVVIREALSRGWSFDAAASAAFVLVVVLAAAVTRWVEQPAMKAIRKAYRERRA